MTEIIVVTSGKGGVGKTTTSAPASRADWRSRGKKVAVIDFDIGLRNLDLIMGCERRVVYDFVNVINGECTLQAGADQGQAARDAVRAGGLADARQGRADRRRASSACSTSCAPTASTTCCAIRRPASRRARTWRCTSPTAPSSWSTPKSPRCATPTASSACWPARPGARSAATAACRNICCSPATTRDGVAAGEMMGVEDVKEILGLDVVGVDPGIRPTCSSASNAGTPVILERGLRRWPGAYTDAVARLLGETRAAAVHR